MSRALAGRSTPAWSRALALHAGLALLAGCGGGDRPGPRAMPPSAPVLEVQRGTLEDRQVLSGEVEAVSSENLTVPQLPVWGSLSISWLAEDGSLVKKGDRVVEFDASTVASTLEDKRTAVTNAENELASEIAKASLDILAKVFEVEKARGELAKATVQASVPVELTPPREYQEKRLLLQTARDKLTAAEEALAARQQTAQLDRKVKEVSRERAVRELLDLRKRLEDLTLRAPRDGMVQIAVNVYERRKYLVGDQEDPGWLIASLPDLSAMQVRARLSDVDDGAVAPGMAAECFLDAYPQKSFRGTVKKLSPAARAEGRDSLRRFFEVLVSLDSQAPELMRPGMSVRVEVIRRRAEGALVVPRVAVSRWPGRTELRLRTSDGPDAVGAVSGRPVPIEVDFCTELACVVRGELVPGARIVPPAPAPAQTAEAQRGEGGR